MAAAVALMGASIAAPTVATADKPAGDSGGLVGSAQGSGPALQSFGIKRSATAQAKVDLFCDNSGSTISLTGDIPLGQVGGSVTLANNTKGTHRVLADMKDDVVISFGEDYPMNLGVKAPAFGGVGGNPHFVLELRDADTHQVLVDDANNNMDFYIGRCVAPSTHITANILDNFPLTAQLDSLVTGLECSQAASQLDVKFAVGNEGVEAVVLMLNNVQKGLTPGTPGVMIKEVPGTLISTPVIQSSKGKGGKGWWDSDHMTHGPGGNPRVYDRPTGTAGDSTYGVYDITAESTWGAYLGRCNKLMPV